MLQLAKLEKSNLLFSLFIFLYSWGAMVVKQFEQGHLLQQNVDLISVMDHTCAFVALTCDLHIHLTGCSV